MSCSAAELIDNRADHTKLSMGLTNWWGAKIGISAHPEPGFRHSLQPVAGISGHRYCRNPQLCLWTFYQPDKDHCFRGSR